MYTLLSFNLPTISSHSPDSCSQTSYCVADVRQLTTIELSPKHFKQSNTSECLIEFDYSFNPIQFEAGCYDD